MSEQDDAELLASPELLESLEQMRQGLGTVVRSRPVSELVWRHGSMVKELATGETRCDRCGKHSRSQRELASWDCVPDEPDSRQQH